MNKVQDETLMWLAWECGSREKIQNCITTVKIIQWETCLTQKINIGQMVPSIFIDIGEFFSKTLLFGTVTNAICMYINMQNTLQPVTMLPLCRSMCDSERHKSWTKLELNCKKYGLRLWAIQVQSTYVDLKAIREVMEITTTPTTHPHIPKKKKKKAPCTAFDLFSIGDL